MTLHRRAPLALKYTFVLLLSVALIGCGKSDNKSQAAATSSKPADVQAKNATATGQAYSTVRAEGTGKSFDEALQNALVLAAGQVNGSRVTHSVDIQSLISDYHTQASSNEQYSASASDKAQANATLDAHAADGANSQSLHSSANDSSQSNAQISDKSSTSGDESGAFASKLSTVKASSAMSGVVRRFQVSSQRQDHGQWTVAIVAEIPVYEASAASRRVKIAVLPFRLASDNSTSNNFEENVRSQVIDALSQSGKVAVLDRDYAQEDQAELAQLQTEDFSKDQAAKLGNKLGADFIIVGIVSKAAVTQDSMYMAGTGQRIYGATHANAQITFRLVEAATGIAQLSVTLNAAQYAAVSLDAVARAEAADLTGRVLDSLYPLRIESVSDGVFYLGRGGDSMHVGEQFRVVKLGNPIVDSDTHEVIGHSEKNLGKIVVTEVEGKMSQAKALDGTTVQVTDVAGLIARPLEHIADAPGNAAAPRAPASAKPRAKAGGTPNNGPKAGVDY